MRRKVIPGSKPPASRESPGGQRGKAGKQPAVEGAAPAFGEPLHVGRPNIGSREAFFALVDQIFDERWLTNNGRFVQQFEREVATLHGAKHCVAMCNGTIALEIAIRALGMTGEVIVPSYTFVATAHALHWQGITPVFADVDPATHNLDPDAVRSMITPRTTGIIGVHVWGRAAPAKALQAIADEHGLRLLFDAAHAFGCSYLGPMARAGQPQVLSFHATKSFNSFEGGAVLTDDDRLAEAMRLMRNFGFAGFDNVIHPGTNGKMVEVCAAMGIVNLSSFAAVVEANRAHYERYRRKLDGKHGLSVAAYDPRERPNYQYVVVEVSAECPRSRDEIVQALHAQNVLARKYFWPGCHRMKPYRELFPHAGLVLGNTERVADRVLLLPTGPALAPGDVDLVCRLLEAIVRR